ncbi:hypothetical protein BGCPKDLD_2595 [Methylorubrum suomiense]|uniref:Uncharacterized protein n=1 Tax=Methylorubrum suomiense TaxID=144191 RepID=A0ABQ4UW16_9HYPH|nr:hypothetical protein BGCPKDLD_2595 [Methylorubrum suomiense]
MLNLRELRNRAQRLANFLPWLALELHPSVLGRLGV